MKIRPEMPWLLCIVYTNQQVQCTRLIKVNIFLLPKRNCLTKSAQGILRHANAPDGNTPKQSGIPLIWYKRLYF